jgi:hypothetical protein
VHASIIVKRVFAMVPDTFETFFLASAGTGGALIGLLFVAISIHPRNTFEAANAAGAQNQRLAEATLLALLNGFVVSSIALIPGANPGGVALVFGVAGFLAATFVCFRAAGLHRHNASRLTSWRHVSRVVLLGAIASGLYALQAALGLEIVRDSPGGAAFPRLAMAIVGLYAVGVVRAWTLLGNPQHGWSGWLNPLQDLTAPGGTEFAQEETGQAPVSA